MSPVERMPAAQAVVSVLESEGVEVMFGIPGAAVLPSTTPALEHSSIKHIIVRHEEGGTHAADAYSRATGGIGVAVGTSGPAGTNMVTGLYTAWADSIPILTITGQAPVGKLHQEAFQAVDIAEIVKPVVKKSYLVKEAAQLPGSSATPFAPCARAGRAPSTWTCRSTSRWRDRLRPRGGRPADDLPHRAQSRGRRAGSRPAARRRAPAPHARRRR